LLVDYLVILEKENKNVEVKNLQRYKQERAKFSSAWQSDEYTVPLFKVTINTIKK